MFKRELQELLIKGDAFGLRKPKPVILLNAWTDEARRKSLETRRRNAAMKSKPSRNRTLKQSNYIPKRWHNKDGLRVTTDSFKLSLPKNHALRKAPKSIDGTPVFIDPKFPGTFSAATTIVDEDGDHVIIVNPKAGRAAGYEYWNRPDIARKLYEQGNFSTPDPLHTLKHEAAHVKFAKRVGFTNYAKARSIGYSFKIGNRRFGDIAKKVSRDATGNGVEFVAETYVGLKHGIKYDDEVMKLYRAFMAPPVTNELIVNTDEWRFLNDERRLEELKKWLNF